MTALHIAVREWVTEQTLLICSLDARMSIPMFKTLNASHLHWGRLERRCAHRRINQDWMTPLYVATWDNIVSIVRLIIECPEVDVNCRCDDNGDTPLIATAHRGCVAATMVKIKIKIKIKILNTLHHLITYDNIYKKYKDIRSSETYCAGEYGSKNIYSPTQAAHLSGVHSILIHSRIGRDAPSKTCTDKFHPATVFNNLI